MELIFNLRGEFWWSPEGPVSQIHSPHLHVGAPGIFSDLLKSVQMLKREWGAGIYRTYWIPGKTAALVPEFAEEDLPPAELQLRFLRLQCRICIWAEHSDDDDDDDDDDDFVGSITVFFFIIVRKHKFVDFSLRVSAILY